MTLSASVPWWFLPLVLPICFYVCFTDLRDMRITNQAVIALAAVFVVLGPFALPFDTYLWRLAQLGVVLLVGFVLTIGGAMGAGDAKFLAAAAPYVAVADLRFVVAIFAANLLAAFATHRLAKHTALRRIAPDWKSWNMGWKFPMGLSLGSTLAIYLILAVRFGA